MPTAIPHRRHFLGAAATSVLGLSLPQWLASQTEHQARQAKAKNVLVVLEQVARPRALERTANQKPDRAPGGALGQAPSAFLARESRERALFVSAPVAAGDRVARAAHASICRDSSTSSASAGSSSGPICAHASASGPFDSACI